QDRLAYFAAHFSLTHACWLITYPLAGWLGSSFGLAVAFGVLCAVSLVAVVLSFLLWPADDPLILEHVHEEVSHEHEHVHDEHHQHEHEGWEGPEPHSHPHTHRPIRHAHAYVVDMHHREWPS
ncbi:MAG: MFS transporter, partial [Pseudomonadota bacterium]